MKKAFSIFLFILAGLTIFGGIGNLVIRSFYGFKPAPGYIFLMLMISGLLTWVGITFWRK